MIKTKVETWMLLSKEAESQFVFQIELQKKFGCKGPRMIKILKQLRGYFFIVHFYLQPHTVICPATRAAVSTPSVHSLLQGTSVITTTCGRNTSAGTLIAS